MASITKMRLRLAKLQKLDKKTLKLKAIPELRKG